MTEPDNKSLVSPPVLAPVKTRNIEINKKLCKQCGLCVHFCPKKVFALDDELFPKLVDWKLAMDAGFVS